MNKRFPLLVILLFPVFLSAIAWYFWFSPVTTVILVRHAERLNDTDTTSISEIGIQRAQSLAHVLSASSLSRIYVSEKVRTLQTAAPTASAMNIAPIQIPANQISRYVDSIKSHRGDVILVVGHSDTVPKIIAKCGLKSPPAIERNQFDNLFFVTMYRFRTTMVWMKYGNPS